MGAKIVITNTRKQTQMVRASHNAAHKRYHLSVANDIRKQAEMLESELNKYLASHDIEQDVLDAAQSQITELKARAIAEENSKCMDKH